MCKCTYKSFSLSRSQARLAVLELEHDKKLNSVKTQNPER